MASCCNGPVWKRTNSASLQFETRFEIRDNQSMGNDQWKVSPDKRVATALAFDSRKNVHQTTPLSARKQGHRELQALERAIAEKARDRQLGLRSSAAVLPSVASLATHAVYPVTPQPLTRDDEGETSPDLLKLMHKV